MTDLHPAYRAEFLKLPSESDIARELGREVDTDAVHLAPRDFACHARTRVPTLGRTLRGRRRPPRPIRPIPRARACARCGRRARSPGGDRRALGDRPRRAALPRGRQYDRRHRRAIDPLSSARTGARRGARAFLCALAGRAARARQMVRGAGPGGPARFGRDGAGAPLHPKFSLKNPNRIRALLGSFASANPTGFNRADGAGYQLLAAQALEIDRFNPHVAARMLGSFESWRILEPGRQARAKAVLRISRPNLCPPTVTRSSQKPLGRLESRLVNGLLTEFPQLSSGQPTPSSIPMTMWAISEMRHFSGSMQEKVRGEPNGAGALGAWGIRFRGTAMAGSPRDRRPSPS